MIDQLLHNVLVVMAKRNNGIITVTVKEVDEAVELLMMESDMHKQTFTFRLVTDEKGSH